MKIIIAMPCLDKIETQTVRSMFSLERPEGCDVSVEFMESSLVYLSRDRLSVIALEERADYILFLDSDMVFQPDLLKALLEDAESGKDLVTGLCFRRRPEYNPAIWKRIRMGLPGESVIEEFDDYPEGELFEVDGAGMAAMLIRATVLKEIFETQKALFAPIPGYGEDVSFCLRARKAGFTIWCDSRVKVGHIATTIVTDETFKAWKKKREEIRNAK